MRIVNKKERVNEFYSEKYDLNGSYFGKENIPTGVLLLYILVKDCGVIFKELFVEADGEQDEAHTVLSTTDGSLFGNLEELSDTFKTQRFISWELACEYSNVNICISGKTNETVLSIKSPLTSEINFLPLMSLVETSSYNYHDYEPVLINRLKEKFGMNQKVTIQTLLKLEKHSDIYNEFVKDMSNDSFSFPTDEPIRVEGFSAEDLFNNYSLSELGAYNYLIYLREDKSSALEDLKNGLPRK